MRYHGNYCGPDWSAGEHQPSVVSDVPPIDEFDGTCKPHDATYALGGDLLQADLDFYHANIGKGLKRSVAALAVGAQAAFRAIDKSTLKIYNSPNKMTTPKTKLRAIKGNNGNPQGSTPAKANNQLVTRSSASVSTVPAAYGFTIKMQKPRVERFGNKARIIGADYAASVIVSTTSTTYEPAASVLINPCFFQSAMLGSLARIYEKFRVKRATLQYVPQVATSTAGQLIFTSSGDVKQPFINGSSSTFLSRALSQHNAVACPLWKETSMEIPTSDTWLTVDAFVDNDLNDSIPQEIQVYCTGTTAATAGILMLHYDLEFSDPLYTYHPSMIPTPYGNGVTFTQADNSAVNATTDAIVLTAPVLLAYGTVFRLIFVQAKSTLPTGPGTWAAVAKIGSEGATTSSGSSVNFTNISLVTGSVLYGQYTSSGLHLYGGLEEASSGGLNGALLYQTATTAVGSWFFLGAAIRIGAEFRMTTQ